MKAKDLLPGTKVDINVIQLMNKEVTEEISGMKKATFMTTIYDVNEDGTIELYMPMEEAKLRILPKNIRYEFVYHMGKNIYKAEGTVVEHLKRGNIYLLRTALTTEIKKFQRREFYRIECLLSMNFVAISPETAKRNTLEQVFYDIDAMTEMKVRGVGTLLDISGGGARFVSSNPLENQQFILTQFVIKIGGVERNMDLVAEIVSSQQMPEDTKYVHRAKFYYKDAKDRDAIISFVFEEERRLRKKEKGVW